MNVGTLPPTQQKTMSYALNHFRSHVFLFTFSYWLLIHLLLRPPFVLPLSSCPFLPLPPPQGFLVLPLPLIQTSWGFFHRGNYRQLGAQRITFSVQGKAKARRERTSAEEHPDFGLRGCVCVRSWESRCVWTRVCYALIINSLVLMAWRNRNILTHSLYLRTKEEPQWKCRIHSGVFGVAACLGEPQTSTRQRSSRAAASEWWCSRVGQKKGGSVCMCSPGVFTIA